MYFLFFLPWQFSAQCTESEMKTPMSRATGIARMYTKAFASAAAWVRDALAGKKDACCHWESCRIAPAGG